MSQGRLARPGLCRADLSLWKPELREEHGEVGGGAGARPRSSMRRGKWFPSFLPLNKQLAQQEGSRRL